MKNTDKIKPLVHLTDELEQFISDDSFFAEASANTLESLHSINAKLKERKYTVAVIAAMKAGKSTLFNALLGDDILPNETAACTVAITEIKHSSRDSGKVKKHLKNGEVIELASQGCGSIQEQFLADIRETRSRGMVDQIAKYSMEHTIHVLKAEEYQELVEKFVLIDTPGPNEAGNGDFDTRQLKETAYFQLRNADAIIFVLDYQVYQSDTNASLLRDIFAGREDIRKDTDKIFFVINKLDARNSKDGTKDEIIDAVRKMIAHHTGGVISNPQVIGVSALMALYGRTIANEKISEDNRQDCKDKYSLKYANKQIVNGEEWIKPLSDAELAEKLLSESGIDEFEKSAILGTFTRASEKLINGATEMVHLKLDAIKKDVAAHVEIQNKDIGQLADEIKLSKAEVAGLAEHAKTLFGATNQEVKALNLEIQGKVNGIADEVEVVMDAVLKEYHDTYESTDPESLNRISDELARKSASAMENYMLRKQDEIIRSYDQYRNDIAMKIHRNMNELSRRADNIIRENLEVEVETGGMFVASIEPGTFFDQVTQCSKIGKDSSDQELADQTSAGIQAAILGASAGYKVAGPIGAFIGACAGFFCGIGSYEPQDEAGKVKYKLDTTKMKKKLKLHYLQEGKKIQQSFDDYIQSEVRVIEETINTIVTGFIAQVSRYLDELVKSIESEKGKRKKVLGHLGAVSGRVTRFEAELKIMQG